MMFPAVGRVQRKPEGRESAVGVDSAEEGARGHFHDYGRM